MVPPPPSSSINPSLGVKIPAIGEGKITINVRSPTSEMYTEVNEADKVKDLERLIKKAWADNNEDYMVLYYKSIQLKSEQFLSSYNLRDGSVVTVSLLTEPPMRTTPAHYLHHQSKSSCEVKKKSKLNLETSSSSSNGENGCGNIVFHMISQFCSSIFSSH